MSLDCFQARVLDGVPHGFFGVSAGNCSLAEMKDESLANRAAAADAVLPGARLVGVYQTHSADCVTLTEPWADAERPRADALVTDRRGMLLSVLSADCAPVLLADREAGVVGAAHAGWRGAIGGVTDSAIAAMLALGARVERMVAAVGPCIARPSYEVDDAFRERFLTDDPANDRFFADGPRGQPHFDLEAYVGARLAAAGLARVEALGQDTYSQPYLYYSYRRATHRGDPSYGRQISLIALA